MNHKAIKYEFPKDNKPTMACESPAALQQYADDLRYGMELLSTLSPEKLHHIIVYISDYTKDDSTIEKRFNDLFENWWAETCIYSGPNLCYNNSHFKEIKAMGKTILPFIDAKVLSEPQYKQRHITWLRKGIEA